MHRLDQLGLEDILSLGSALRSIGRDFPDATQAGIEAVRLLYNRLRDFKGNFACPLVRLYRTRPANTLDGDLPALVKRLAPGLPSNCRCLVLEATSGDLDEWNCPRHSAGHKAIPLASPEQIANLPMVARLLEQFGLAHSTVSSTDPIVAEAGESFGVFHVPRARGSPYIPAQDNFVVPHGIESVLGFGGMLPGGEFFALLLFSRVPIDQPTASLFKTIGIVVREILLPREPANDPAVLSDLLQSKKMLVEVLEQAAFTQTRRVAQLHETIRAEDKRLLGQANKELTLIQEQLQARERLASLGALTAGIAHEIKNPINFIVNFAEIGHEIVEELAGELNKPGTGVPPPVTACMDDLRLNLAKIVEHSRRADGVVKTMLLHARGEATRPRPCMLGQVVEEYANLAYHSHRAQFSDSQAQLRIEWDKSLEWVEAVPEHIGRVIINLVGNSFYSVWERQKREGPGYKPLVEVRITPDGNHAEIRVWDNGEGISPDILPHIFDPFFTTKPAGAGTGQGLSISHDVIVSEHGGEMRAESVPMRHTEFTIRLPIKSPKLGIR